MSDYGFKITTKEGADITSTSPLDYALHSSYDTMKMAEEHVGLSNYTFDTEPGADTTTNILTIAHGLSFVPSALVYVEDVTSDVFSTLRYNLSLIDVQRFIYYTDSTNFKIDYVVGASGPLRNINGDTFNFKYYIFSNNGV